MIVTKAAFFLASPEHRPLLPPEISFPGAKATLPDTRWDLLALNHVGCRTLLANRIACSCKTLLLPGNAATAITQLVQANQVVSTGLSPLCTITFSSLMDSQALVCIQRTLIRPDGTELEPQELPMPLPSLPPEEQLLLLGMQLLL